MSPSPDTLFVAEAAMYYAALGWPVFPVLPNGKRPLTEHGYKDASTAEPQIKRWWHAHPDANLGLDCGGAGLVVIDVDAKQGGREAWARLDPGVATLSSTTGGGGLHIFYRAPKDAYIANSAGRLAPGIDVRATGGYVVLPPSRHPSGNPYRWCDWREVAELPASLYERLTEDGRLKTGDDGRPTIDDDRPTTDEALPANSVQPLSSFVRRPSSVSRPPSPFPPSPYAASALSAETQSVRQAANGTRNDQLHRSAFNLGQLVGAGQLPQAYVEAALSRAARQSGLPDGEIRKTLASGLQAGMERPRRRTVDGGRWTTDDGRRTSPSGRGGTVDEGRQTRGGEPSTTGRPQGIAPTSDTHGRPSRPASVDPLPHPLSPPPAIISNLQSPTSHPSSAVDRPSSPARPPSIVYLIEDGRIVSKIVTTNGLVTRELCNFQAALTATLIIDDGERKRRIYSLSGRNTRGRVLPEARIDAAEFDAMRWVSDHWGAHAIISAGHSARDHLSRAILHLSQDSLHERQVYTYTGWRSDGDTRTFLGSEDAEVTLELERELEHYHLPAAPQSREEAREAMRASLAFLDIAQPHISIPLWAAMYLAPTCEFVMPRFALWLYGVTGSLKSTLAALALNHFGDWIVNDLAGWSSTANSLGKILFLAKDVPFVVDDFAPQSERHAAERQESVASELVRAIGNHSGRSRMRADLSLAAVYRPRGLLISTGEQLPDVGSILSRILTVEVRRSEIDLAKLTQQQAGRARYGHAMAGFVQWLGAHWDELKERAPQEAAVYSDQLRAGGQHLRVPDGLGLLYSGYVRALRYAEEVGALTAEQAEQWRATGWQVMLRLAEKQGQIVADERPVLRFLTTLGELLTQGKLRLDPLRPKGAAGATAGEADTPLIYLGGAEGTLIGYHSPSYFHLLPSAAYNTVAKFARDEGRIFGTKAHMLWKALAEEGILDVDDEQHYSAKVMIQGESRRMLRLHRSAVEKILGSLLAKNGEVGKVENMP